MSPCFNDLNFVIESLRDAEKRNSELGEKDFTVEIKDYMLQPVRLTNSLSIDKVKY